MRKLVLAAAIPALAFAVAAPKTAQAEPVEYVRVCDAFGSGYFYIPGTETCLRISGGVDYQYSWLENTHSLGGGTVVRPGKEGFGARYGDWIERNGIKLDFRAKVRDATGLGKSGGFEVYGGYEGAWGSEGYSSNDMVGSDGVTGVGYTFLRPDMTFGTGAIATSPGFGLQTDGSLDNSWTRLNLGLKIASPIVLGEKAEDGGGSSGFSIKHRIGVYFETLDTEASGRADLTYYGSPYGGYFQTYDLDAKDRYYGLRLGTRVGLPSQLDGKLRFAVSGDLYLGYHTGDGSYSQYSEVGGSPVLQTEDYSKNGFAVGAGLSASATYKFASGWRLGANVEWSCLPDVTSFKAPENPDQQDEAGFSSERATRYFTGIRLSRSF